MLATELIVEDHGMVYKTVVGSIRMKNKYGPDKRSWYRYVSEVETTCHSVET